MSLPDFESLAETDPREAVVALTAALIRFPTTHDRPEAIEACAAFVREWLERAGLAVTPLHRGTTPSMLVTPRPGSAPVLLMSHIDVVAAPEALFAPVRRDGRLFGRGSIDDKYAVALSMVLLRDWLARLRCEGLGQEGLPFGVLITGDEEAGGRDGADYGLSQVRGRFCIALDGGGPDEIVVREKGLLRLRVACRGRSAHGARPWMGDNAIDRLAAAVARIREDFPAPRSDDHWHRTFNLSRIRGGDAPNQVPDRAEAVLDIRFTEDDDIEALLADWQRAVDGELTVLNRADVFAAGATPELDRLCRVVPGVRLTREHGASDARYLVAHGWDGVVWGADGEMSQHGGAEHVIETSLATMYRRLDRFFQALPAGGGRPGDVAL